MPTRRELLKAAVALAPVTLSGRLRDLTRRPASRVVVVGAGAFGGWTALDLARRGASVTLIDAWGAGNSRASSGGETRVIRAVYNARGPAVRYRNDAGVGELRREADVRHSRE